MLLKAAHFLSTRCIRYQRLTSLTMKLKPNDNNGPFSKNYLDRNFLKMYLNKNCEFINKVF